MGVLTDSFGVLTDSYDDKTVAAIQQFKGGKITAIDMTEENILFTFPEGKLKIFDGASMCCEHRFMKTDDDLSSFVGGLCSLMPQQGKQLTKYGVNTKMRIVCF